MVMEVQVGDAVEMGEVLATVYHRDGDIATIMRSLESAFSFSDSEPEATSRVFEVIR